MVDYQEYIKTDKWQNKRQQILTFWNHRCCLCYRGEGLHVHHRTYESLGNELITDCIVLCEQCHQRHHLFMEYPEASLIWLRKAMELCDAPV